MQTRLDEIADGIFRLSTFFPDVTPDGFTFNQFLVRAEEPLLFHLGMRGLFPSVKEAMARVLDPATLRWLGFGHFEADECGAMNAWLQAAPRAQAVHGRIGVMVNVNDAADRPPRALADGEVVDLGGKRVRFLDTPHVPHGWDAGVMFEETTSTLLCGDLFTRTGDGPPLTGGDVVGPARHAEELFQSSCLTPATAPTIRRLAELRPRTLALMHGSSFEGDASRAILDLAEVYEGLHAARR